MSIKKKLIISLILLCILPLLILSSIYIFIFYNQNSRLIHDRLSNSSDAYAQKLSSFFYNEKFLLSQIAENEYTTNIMSQSDILNQNAHCLAMRENIEILFQQKLSSYRYIDKIMLVDSSGIIVSTDKESNLLSAAELYKRGKMANPEQLIVSEVTVQNKENGFFKSYAVGYPVYHNNIYKGLVVQLINGSYFGYNMGAPLSFATEYSIILDQNLNVVDKFKSDCIVENNFNELESSIKQAAARDEGWVEYYCGDEKRIGYISTVDSTGWLVMCSVAESEFLSPIITAVVFTILFSFILIIIILIIYLLTIKYLSEPIGQMLSSIRSFMSGDYSVRVEYKQKDEIGEIAAAINSLADTVEKDTRELKLRDKRYKTVMRLVDSIIFEWNLLDDTFYFSKNWRSKFAYSPDSKDDRNINIIKKFCIFHEDEPEFNNLIKLGLGGVKYAESEVRIKGQNGIYLWCRIKLTTVKDENEKTIKILGAIIDIDREKREAEKLLKKSETDSLSGFFNKQATEDIIKDYISGEGKNTRHALLILDIDNFKCINDTFGHLYGDAVLKDISDRAKKLFRSSDVIGRVGGDEFVAFIKNISTDYHPQEKAEALLHVIRDTFTGDKRSYQVSGSIGIAIYPDDGESFTELYKNADQAMYCAKNNGKDCYAMYRDISYEKDIPDNISSEQKKMLVRGSRLAEITEGTVIGSVVQHVFEILYSSSDIDKALSSIMMLLGREFGVSRVYIVEDDKDKPYCSNIYQWCSTDPPVSPLQKVPGGMYKNYKKYFDSSGVFYCNNISVLEPEIQDTVRQQGVYSMLQCAITDRNKFIGIVGFDECSGSRLWTQREIDALVLISKIVASFVFKKSVEKGYLQLCELAAAALENMADPVYIVELDSSRIIYVNKTGQELYPVHSGQNCSSVFGYSWAGLQVAMDEDSDEYIDFYFTQARSWIKCTVTAFNFNGSQIGIIYCHKVLSSEDRELRV